MAEREDCIIEGCNNPNNGHYVTHRGFKTGPYCIQHKVELECPIDKRKRMMIESNWNTWVSEFQFDTPRSTER